MKKGIHIFILILITQVVFSQTKETDSLYNRLKTSRRDTNRVILQNTLSRKLSSINPNIAMRYAQKAYLLAAELDYKEGEIKAFSNIGIVYYGRGDYPNALKSFLRAEKMLETNPNNILLSDIYNNTALVYVKIGKVSVAKRYFNRCIQLDKSTKNYKGLGEAYNNLGSIYGLRNDLKNEKRFYELSKKYREISNDIEKLPLTLSNLAKVNIQMNNLSTASRQINQALILCLKNDDIVGLSMMYNEIGDLRVYQGKYDEAIEYYTKSLALSKQYRIQSYTQHSFESLAGIYEKKGDYKKANYYFKLNAKIKDNIYNSENSKHLAEMQAKYQSEKKQRELLKRKSELDRKNTQINIFRIGFALIILLVIYIIYNLREKLKINKIILKQKQAVEIQNRIIEEKNRLVEDQNKDIRDSIKYAKRIQSAILPPKELWSDILPDSFVIYRPKDILSGDFNWIAETETHIFVAAADCTGHGVPGALISLVNYNLLNKAVLEKGLVKTGEILDAVNSWLTESLHQRQENSTVKDGMDICLISINKETKEIHFSGAYNSLYLVSDGILVEFKGDKFPVGSFVDEKKNLFTTKKIDLKPGDMLYMLSDGYADQFGGDKGKKYKYKKLKDNLIKISSFDMNYQRSFLLSSFYDWKGDFPQVDDVLVIGYRYQ